MRNPGNRAGLVIALALMASVTVACEQQPLGTTVGGEPCGVDLHAGPRSVQAGERVTIRRAPGCDQDNARQMTVFLASSTGGHRHAIGTADLDADGGVLGKITIPPDTRRGPYALSLDEESGCNDTASCHGTPVWVGVSIR